MSTQPITPVIKLLEEVEALEKAFLGCDAEGQPWIKTLSDIERMAKLAKQVRSAIRKAGGEA